MCYSFFFSASVFTVSLADSTFSCVFSVTTGLIVSVIVLMAFGSVTWSSSLLVSFDETNSGSEPANFNLRVFLMEFCFWIDKYVCCAKKSFT